MTERPLSGSDLQSRFLDADARRTETRSEADKLRAERAVLMAGWAALAATQDFDQIAQHARRLAEIDRALVRLAV